MSQEVKLDEKLNLKKDFPVSSFDEWKKQVEQDLKGESFEKKLITKTYEGIDLQPIYTSNDIKDLPQLNSLPGFDNYLRGSFAAGFNGRDWEISQEFNQALPEEINDALIHDLKRGLNSVNILLDNPTQLGLDADQSKSGEVGKDGLSISGVRKMLVLFKDIDLTNQPINISGGFSALPITLLFNAYANETRTSLMNIKGSITSDPYDYLLTKGQLPFSFKQIFYEIKLATELMIKSNSAIKTIGVSGTAFNDSGANAVQELAFTLASAVDYLNEMTSQGLNADDVAKRIKFTFNIGSFYFMEAAKLRAARMLWGLDVNKALLMNINEIPTANNLHLSEIFPDETIDLSLRTRWASTTLERYQKQTIELVDQFCTDYEKKIREKGGIGFFLGGIGPDGHIGFNVMGSDHYSTTRLIQTNYETQAAAATDLGGVEVAKKRLVITIGLDTITYNTDATAIIIAAGEAKGNIVRDSIQSSISNKYPATVLQRLPNARFYLTNGAAFRLVERRYQDVSEESEISHTSAERAIINLCLERNKSLLDLRSLRAPELPAPGPRDSGRRRQLGWQRGADR